MTCKEETKIYKNSPLFRILDKAISQQFNIVYFEIIIETRL